MVIGSLAPNCRYWTLRLTYYDHLMVGAEDWADVDIAIDNVAASEGAQAKAEHPAEPEGAAVAADREKVVRTALRRRLASNAARGVKPGRTQPALAELLAKAKEGAAGADFGARATVGNQTRLKVNGVLAQVMRVLPVLEAAANEDPTDATNQARLWRNGLGLSPAMSAETLLERLLFLEVATTALGDEVNTGATLPVELVQLSAQTQNTFATHSRTADEKLGGWSVNRFGGFLKRSWRANDWTWGRVDAATVLCRTVLHPGRIRRAARLSGYLALHSAAERAEATLAEVLDGLFAGPPPPALTSLVEKARAELVLVLGDNVHDGDLPTSLPALASLFAWVLHEDIVVQELPEIAAAIRADKIEGGYQRSRGEVFLATEGPLLKRLDEAPRTGPGQLSHEERVRALDAFDAAGIGREPLREESSSDMTIRTATAAAAVAATVLSSGRTGLKAISPVTKAVRGLMLLPYWVVTGLTAKGGLARNLSLLALAFGGTLLALSLFGALPEAIAGPATALGGSAVLVAFAYAAMRTGTLLHGVVLLSPVIPLLTYAVVRARRVDTDPIAPGVQVSDAATQGAITLVVVAALAGVLMLLGSFGATYGSVWSELDRLADRRGVPDVWKPPWRPARPRPAWSRWVTGLVRSLRAPGLGLLGVAVLAAGVAIALQADWALWMDNWSRPGWVKWTLLAVVVLGLMTVGAVLSARAGRSLRLLAPTTVVDAGQSRVVWRPQRLANPRGMAVGWSVLYGSAYLGLAVVFLIDPFGTHAALWHRVALVTTVVFAVALVLVVPFVLPRLEFHAISRGEQTRARSVGVTVEPQYAMDLAVRGLGYLHYVKAGAAPALTDAGKAMRNRAARAVVVAPPGAAQPEEAPPAAQAEAQGDAEENARGDGQGDAQEVAAGGAGGAGQASESAGPTT